MFAKQRLLVIVLMALLLSQAAPVHALSSTVRVKLFEAHANVNSIVLKGPFEIIQPAPQRIVRDEVLVSTVGELVRVRELKGGRPHPIVQGHNLILEARSERGITVKVNSRVERSYGGRLHITWAGNDRQSNSDPDHSNLRVLNEIPAIDYIASVVGSESPPNCPSEALRALTVLTVMIVERKAHGDVIGDSTKEQAYKGKEYARPYVMRAVRSVFHQRLCFQKIPIQPFFHSTCGGGTSSGADIFGDDAEPLTYLQPVKCSYCKQSPFWQYKSSLVPAARLRTAFDGGLPEVVKRDEAGRPLAVRLGKTTITGYVAWLKVGRTLGWGLVPGTRYEIAGLPDGQTLKIRSNGAGHGVGLCQWGAVGMAQAGKSYQDILKFYFPGCELASPRPRGS